MSHCSADCNTSDESVDDNESKCVSVCCSVLQCAAVCCIHKKMLCEYEGRRRVRI